MELTLVTGQEGKIIQESAVANSKFEGLKRVALNSGNHDLMYLHFVLLHEGPNKNNDYFTRKEIGQVHKSFIGKPITWEHEEPYIGFITDSYVVEPEEGSADQRLSIECAGVVWKKRFEREAVEIQEGFTSGNKAVSMEVYFSDAVYSINGELETTYKTFNEALESRTNPTLPIYRVFKNTIGGGAGIVGDPADVDAILLAVAKKNEQNLPLVSEYISGDVCEEKEVPKILEKGGNESMPKKANENQEEIKVVEVQEAQAEEEVVETDEEKVDEEKVKLEERIKELEEEVEKLEYELSQLRESQAKVEELKGEFEKLQEQSEATMKEYQEFKEKVELEKAEAQKDSLANTRLEELANEGVVFASQEKMFNRFREMDEEAYQDIKEVLVANANKKGVEEAKESTEASVKVETKREIQTIPNLEQEAEASLKQKYEQIWEKIFGES